MRRQFGLLGIAGVLLVAAIGCARNPYVVQGRLEDLKGEYDQLAARNRELEQTMQQLDQNNQELQTQVARALQRARIHEKDAKALRSQLKETATQLAQVRSQKKQLETHVDRELDGPRRPKATITANSSIKKKLPPFNLPGVEIRQDEDVIRVELPADEIFEADDIRIRPEGRKLIDRVTTAIGREYPEQIIGVEGHTDDQSLPQGSKWLSPHHLTVGRAMAVYDQIVNLGTVPIDHLFIVGHGPNHPVVSNGSAAGRARNRRVELVIYPEQIER